MGTLGAEAYKFVDFLQSGGFKVWQILPINPTQYDGSPYQCSSVHAGNPRFIDLHFIKEKGWLDQLPCDQDVVSVDSCHEVIAQGWNGFKQRASDADWGHFDRFCNEQGFWLEDYALFQALHKEQGASWHKWPVPLRDRDPEALAEARVRVVDQIAVIRFQQYLFHTQWVRLKRYANERGVLLFGDVPIFVAHDSAEVWSRREIFDLLPDGKPRVVAGVPPDYFSATGQRWGNPLYRWSKLEQSGFAFWIERLRTQSLLFDFVRIDHFRGFEAYWEIPASEATAINGNWIKAPGDRLFAKLYEALPHLVLVAEDLGIITPEVDTLRRSYGLPGMKILQFAFSRDPNNPYLPYNHSRDSVVYTGTHDNDTTVGWYENLDEYTRDYVAEFLGYSEEVVPWPLIRAAMASRANLAIIPMQDLLGLDTAHRMNTPGTNGGKNWKWRLDWDMVVPDLPDYLRELVALYGR